MRPGEFLTRATVALALCFAGASAAGLLAAWRRPEWRMRARSLWAIGCALFLAHVVCAFGFHHGWSHADAYAATERQTAQVTGLRWGGGIYFNYCFTLAWLGDVLWWFLRPESHAHRGRWITAVWHWFFSFMAFNATVVFGTTSARLLGFALFAGLAFRWLREVQLRAAVRSPLRKTSAG